MKHKLYTTYLAKLRNNKKLLPDSCQIAIIMRFPPFIPEDGSMIHVPELSPKAVLLNEIKAGKISFDEFSDKLWEQWKKNDEGSMDTLKNIEDALEYNDVCLVCCEKNLDECHRKILGEYFKFAGFEWEEL